MKKVVKSPFAIMLIAVVSLCYGMAAAQTYPTKPVRLIVAFAPGGAADIIGRIIAAQLTEQLGEQIVVDNRGGAGGVIGTEIAAKAKPDGYTLLLFSTAHAINPSLHYEASPWFGIAVPAGTPKAIVDRLNKELSVVLTPSPRALETL